MEDKEKERYLARKRLIRYTHTKVSICEKLREVYDLVYDHPDQELRQKVEDKLIDAMIMTKSIATRFAYFRDKYHDKTGHGGKSLIATPDYKERYERRRVRVT